MLGTDGRRRTAARVGVFLAFCVLLAGGFGWLRATPQKADSPVEWLEDLDLAMARARAEDKPLFLSFNVRYLANPGAGHC